MSESDRAKATEKLRSQFTEEQVSTAIKSMKPIFEKAFPEQIEKINAMIFRYFSDQFVYSLSESNSDLLMWSHYANKHQGAVLRFDCIEELDNVFLAATQVQYKEHFPTFGTKEGWIDILDGGKGSNHEKLYREITTTKSKSWSYEQEWRVVISLPEYNGRDFSNIGFDRREVTEIYLGCAMHSAEREALCILVKKRYPHCKIFQSQKSRETFALDFLELTTSQYSDE